MDGEVGQPKSSCTDRLTRSTVGTENRDLYPRQHHQNRSVVSYTSHTTGQTLSRPEMPTSLLALHPAGSLHRTLSPLGHQEDQDTGKPGTECLDQSQSAENEEGGIFFKGGLVSLLSQKGGHRVAHGRKENLPAHHAHPVTPPPPSFPVHMTRLGRAAQRLSLPYPLPHLGFGLSERNMGRNLMKFAP